MRRAVLLAMLTSSIIVGTQTAALADDLSDRLEANAESTYSGEQTVVCSTPDGDTSEVYRVGQSNGVTVAEDGSGQVRVSRTGDGFADLDERYTISLIGPLSYAGRQVDRVDVAESGTLRLRFLFDIETGAMLSSDVYNSDGTVYCQTRLVDFRPGDPGVSRGVQAPSVGAGSELEEVDERALPDSVGDFARLSVTQGPQESVTSAYYADGVFGFTLLHSVSPIVVPELEEAPVVELEDRRYRRIFDVGTAVYSWESGVGGYVLAGDLPVDVQEDVLELLPAPESVNLFQRIWRNLFD